MLIIGETLKKERKKKKITQAQLAEKIGVRRETLLHIEKGRHQISFENAIKISRILKCSLYDLFENVKEEQNEAEKTSRKNS